MLWLRNHRGLALALTIIAFLGFLDATYLTVEHIIGGTIPCSIFTGCEKVLNSKYSVIGGIPTAFFGVVYYTAIFLLALLSITRDDKKYLLLASKFTIVGLLASIGFVYLQLVVIKAICTYCMLSALISLFLFVVGMIVMLKDRYFTSTK